jgi:hypothetical protein
MKKNKKEQNRKEKKRTEQKRDNTLREGIFEYDPDLVGIYEEADQLVFL